MSESSVDDVAPTPTLTFTLEAQRQFNAFSAGIVQRSALEFVRETPSYFSPKPPQQPGIAGVPFFTSVKSKTVFELQKGRAKAVVAQMGPYKPPSEFSFREEAPASGGGVNNVTAQRQAAAIERDIAELQTQLERPLKSTQKYALKQQLAKKKAALLRLKADFNCDFGSESIQELRKKTAINQEGLFDEEALEPGDQVLVHFPGTSECWRGPFSVVRRINASVFTVHSAEYGKMDVETSRLQDMRIRVPPPSANVTDKHFVRNVGRATAKDAVMALAKANNAARDPYKPPSQYDFVDYDADGVIREKQRRMGETTGDGVGSRSRPVLEAQPAEVQAEARRRRFAETQRKQTKY